MPDCLPDHVAPYKRTPVFTGATVPAGLLKELSTKAGVWGLIRVVKGALVFRDATGESRLDPDRPCVVAPGALHSVEAAGEVAFFVEFWR